MNPLNKTLGTARNLVFIVDICFRLISY